MGKERKKFRDTAVGKFLTKKLPDAIANTGDLLPDSGLLGVVKNLVAGSNMSPDDKAEAFRLLLEEERLFMEDRADARAREVELAKAGKMDWMMKVVGLTILGSFVASLMIVFFAPLENKELAHLVLGELLTMSV